MSTREFTDPEGNSWYLSEVTGSDGRDYLSFDSLDESRRLYVYPPRWTELFRQELTRLWYQAECTWRRGGGND